MATVIAVSSWVARGGVGLRAVMPALAALGHEVVACPTILLSNHLSHSRAGGAAVAPETLQAMIDALDANGWLGGVDAVLTGYLPTPEHVTITAALAERVRDLNPAALVVCDPVLGDAPDGLYVPAAVAEAVSTALLPLATLLKPNLFELEYLSGRSVGGIDDAVAAARALGVPSVLASSVPSPEGRLANVLVTKDEASVANVARETDPPHGTGDLLTALVTAHTLRERPLREAVGRAVAGVASALAASRGLDELQLTQPFGWHEVAPLALSDV